MKIFFIAFLLIWNWNVCFSQSFIPTNETMQEKNWEWGGSMKIAASIYNARPVIRIGTAIGVGTFVLGNSCFPSAHVEWDLYLNGLGTRASSPKRKFHLTTDFFGALTFTTKLGDYNRPLTNFHSPTWNQPLYYWSDFSQAPLQNPYWNSISFGPVWAFSFDKQKVKSKAFIQRIGFINLHVNTVDLSYCNDGGFGMTQTLLGDGRDRIYTGCGHLSYHPKTIDGVNSYEISFHKYTGYTQDAFELSCELNLGFVDYRDSVQQYYSRSELCLRVGSTTQGYAGTIRWINPRNFREIQNLIHYVGDFAQHQISHPSGFSVGMDYSPFFTKISLK